jgi:hypothetical protein
LPVVEHGVVNAFSSSAVIRFGDRRPPRARRSAPDGAREQPERARDVAVGRVVALKPPPV